MFRSCCLFPTSVGDDEARCPAVYASLSFVAALTTCDVARGQTAIADLITLNFGWTGFGQDAKSVSH